MSEPYYSGAVRMGRNKELTDDFTLLEQAGRAIAVARKSANGSKTPNATPANNETSKKVSYPPLSV